MRMLWTLTAVPFAALLIGPAFAAPIVNDQWEELQRTPGAGEICIVCDMPIGSDETAVTIRHRGRTVHVNTKLLDRWNADPGRYFSKVQARSTLFDEEAVAASGVDHVWWKVGVYLVAGLIVGALCAYVAVNRGRCPKRWFIWGLLTNVLALTALLALGSAATTDAPEGVPRGLRKVPRTRTPRPCPSCGSSNHPSARSCLACGVVLQATVDSETTRAGGDS